MDTILVQILFYVFAVLTAFAAFMVIIQNNPVRCVLFLVFAFFTSAVLWMLVEAEFLSLILILVYVGAVMTLFLFVVMMLDVEIETHHQRMFRLLPIGLFLFAGLVALFVLSIPKELFHHAVEVSQVTARAVITNTTNTEQLGIALFTDYVFAFELGGCILLTAIIAAITLIHQTSHRSKRQDIVKQIMTRREDRVTLVSMNNDN